MFVWMKCEGDMPLPNEMPSFTKWMSLVKEMLPSICVKYCSKWNTSQYLFEMLIQMPLPNDPNEMLHNILNEMLF